MPLVTLEPQSSGLINVPFGAVAAPTSDWPAKFTFDEFWKLTELLEGGCTANCMFMGQDLKVATAMGITFTGSANRNAGLAMATALEWIFKLGHPNALRTCSAADIARDYDVVLGMEELGRKGPGHLREWRAATNCRLTVDGLKRAVRKKVLDNINDIRTRLTGDRYLGDFDSFPADAQLCVASMTWANGKECGSPKFRKACREADWFEAARECDVSSTEHMPPRRQKVQAEMMRNAGCVKLGVDSPDALHWPTILSAPTAPAARQSAWICGNFTRCRWAGRTRPAQVSDQREFRIQPKSIMSG